MNYFGIGMECANAVRLDHRLNAAAQDVLREAARQVEKTDWRPNKTGASEVSDDTGGPRFRSLQRLAHWDHAFFPVAVCYCERRISRSIIRKDVA